MMKLRLWIAGMALLLSSTLLAQTATKDVTLHFAQIHGEFGVDYTATYSNWSDVPIEFSRTQFYVSEITLVHNGGQELPLTDLYVLTQNGEPEYDLGSYDLGALEAIRFHVGVPQDVNHLDPATYPANHPLAPQNPTMHWGWDAGYRFIAFEGKVDRDDDMVPERVFQYHGVGNQFYTEIEVPTTGVENGSDLTIFINVDYQEMFRELDMQMNPHSHGEGAEIYTIFDNMVNRDVFTAGMGPAPGPPPPGTTGLSVVEEDVDPVTAFPNPFNFQTQIRYSFAGADNLKLVVADLNGKIVQEYTKLPTVGSQLVQLEQPAGTYMYYFKSTDRVLYQNKITLLD